MLSSATLETRLLELRDLGSGYLRKPERPAQHDGVTVIGCPALSELGGDAATGGTLHTDAYVRSRALSGTKLATLTMSIGDPRELCRSLIRRWTRSANFAPSVPSPIFRISRRHPPGTPESQR
ncbi:hypothetical protein [Streptomyces sp. NBC_01538]|uniref:hypothetical protein n=1 Tax=Streptomyces sp. NBC_01538 TaxID=2903897 RepID=UPI003864ED81